MKPIVVNVYHSPSPHNRRHTSRKTLVVYWLLHRHVVRCERAGNPPFQPLESALAGFFVLTVLTHAQGFIP